MEKQLLLLMMMLLPMVTCAFTGEIEIDGIKYFIATKAKTAEVLANNYSGDIVIPATVECENTICNVTSISNEAFCGCSGLTSVTIPNSVSNYSAPPNKPTQRISKRVAFGEKSHKSVQNHPNLC